MFIHQTETDLTQLPVVKRLPGKVFSKDVGANQVRVIVTNKGNRVTLTGTVRAYIKKPDGTMIDMTGSRDSNIARVVLPSEAYEQEGMLGIYLRIEDSGKVITLGGVEGYCYKSRTNDLVYD